MLDDGVISQKTLWKFSGDLPDPRRNGLVVLPGVLSGTGRMGVPIGLGLV